MGLIVVFILLIACINFMNLSTAQSARRSKEIGVRKMAGANKRKLILQFLGESLLLVCVAHIIAMILVELLLPAFNNLTGKHLAVDYQSAGLIRQPDPDYFILWYYWPVVILLCTCHH